ncbi:hypothetical protein MKX01_011595 [Papaver californicum]|nr:hypothetical protein MKX01_011595 [Papaver californicum]
MIFPSPLFYKYTKACLHSHLHTLFEISSFIFFFLLSSSMSSSSSLADTDHKTDKPLQLVGHSFSSTSSVSSRSSSLESCLSFASYPNDDSFVDSSSPTLRIPFSWEQHPGVPKFCRSKTKNDPSLIVLPLPPAPGNSRKFNLESIFTLQKKSGFTNEQRMNRDPFVAALMECSKEKEMDGSLMNAYWESGNNNNKVVTTRSLNDRFGFIDRYVSCKRSCAVLESKIFVPRSTKTTYDRVRLINNRTSS